MSALSFFKERGREQGADEALPTCWLVNYPLPEDKQDVDLFDLIENSAGAVDIVGPDIKYLRTVQNFGKRYEEIKDEMERYKFMNGTKSLV